MTRSGVARAGPRCQDASHHGADFGRVAAGFEVPGTDLEAFRGFLGQLGYRYHLEDSNLAYWRFLEADTTLLSSPSPT